MEGVEIFFWTMLSFATFLSFLYLPRRLSPSLQRRAHTSADDLASAGFHMHFCVWLWPIIDYLYRFFALILMAPQHAEVFFPIVFDAAQFASSSMAMLFRDLRRTFIPDGSMRDFDEIDQPKKLFVPGFWTHREVCVLVVFTALAIICSWLFLFHIRPTLRLREEVAAARRKRVEERREHAKNAKMNKTAAAANTGGGHSVPEDAAAAAADAMMQDYDEEDLAAMDDSLGLNYVPPLLPTRFWMLLWSLGFATAFLWVKAMPIMMRMVYPACVVVLIPYCMMLP